MNHGFQRRRLFWLACLGWFVLGSGSAIGQAGKLETARDLQSESRMAKQRQGVLVVLFSRKDCKYCDIVRRDHLAPLLHDSRYKDRILVRQINQDSTLMLNDFNGEPTTHSAFSQKEKVSFVPVVAFYGPGGKQLNPPISGLRLPDFYQGYLEDAIEKSISQQEPANRKASLRQ